MEAVMARRVHNFYAGPAALPYEVVQKTAELGILEFAGQGMSIMEISHRSKPFEKMFVQTQENMLKIMGLSSEEYAVLFLGGGASSQFYHVPSSEDKNFSYIPRHFNFTPGAAYVHTTSNNTIYGTEMWTFPDTGNVPHVCDMSSDFLSHPMDFSKFSLIYAGAQKNIGPSGTVAVIVRKSWALEGRKDIPAMVRYTPTSKPTASTTRLPVYPCM
jgi:phosphoserine aminotransferase